MVFFTINIPTQNINDELTFSYMGFKTQKIKISEIDPKKELKIKLEINEILLEEVVVFGKKMRLLEKVNLGQEKSSNKFTYVYGEGSGAEVC